MTTWMSRLAGLLRLSITDERAHAAPAPGIEWETLNAEVISLENQGRYAPAVVVAKKALEVAEEVVGPHHPDVAKSLNNLARLLRKTGRAKDTPSGRGSYLHTTCPARPRSTIFSNDSANVKLSSCEQLRNSRPLSTMQLPL